MAIQLSEKKLNLIEELGMYFEKSGTQPAASRIFALLMVSDDDEITFEEVCESLNMSKSAVSNALNLLIDTHRVEYFTRPGERKRYFRCKVKSLNEGVVRFQDNLGVFNQLLKQVIELSLEEKKVLDKGLVEVTSFIDFMIMELSTSFEKWKEHKK